MQIDVVNEQPDREVPADVPSSTPESSVEISRSIFVFDETEPDAGHLQKQVAQLLEQDQRKNEFLATLAHELRNPLSAMRNGLQLLRLAGDDPAMVLHARSILSRQVEQMVRLVDDLLDASRINSNRVELRKEWVELA